MAGQIINQMEKNDLYKSPTLSYFSLNRLRAHCHYPPVTVDFSNPMPKAGSVALFPVFNNDLRHFTPAFLLPSEKTYSESYLESQHEKFADKMRTQQEQVDCAVPQDSEIGLRASEFKYCQVCKQRFEDYWKHMESHLHKRKIAKSQFNRDITHLCTIFCPQPDAPSRSQETSTPNSRKKKKQKTFLPHCKTQIQMGLVQGEANEYGGMGLAYQE